MSRQRTTKQKSQSQKRVPAPKQRREPLPISISVKHHLPVSAEGTATDLTVAELEAVAREATRNQPLDYSTSQVNSATTISTRSLDRSDRNYPSTEGAAGNRASTETFTSEYRLPASDSIREKFDHSAQTHLPQKSKEQSTPRKTRDQVDLDQLDQDQFDRDRLDQVRRSMKDQFDLINDNSQQRDQQIKDRQIRDRQSKDRQPENVTRSYPAYSPAAFDDLIEDDPFVANENSSPNHKSRAGQTIRNNEPRANKRAPQQPMESINLGVENRFVRVPNAVADQLARQLSPAEEKIFDQIWRLTVGFNREIWRGKISDLMLRTGYSSRATVTKAIAGLSALGLLVVEGRDTNPRGRSYRICDRAQLLDYTNKHHELDHSIKKPATTHAESSRLVERKQVDRASDLLEKRPASSSTHSTSRAFKENHERNDSSGYKPSSSSSWEDDENASQVRLIYQDLTGNSWAKGDEVIYREIAETPLPYVILGICYSITRAADHRIGSLKYCLPSIREHHELMKAFPHKDLLEIAYRHIVRVKEAQRTGKWSRQD